MGVVAYAPLKGATYSPLPKKIKDKKAVLNIQNHDIKCFLWSVLAAKHPITRKDQPQHIHHYKRYENEINMEGIEYPVNLRQVPRVKRQNPEISVNVSGFEKD